MKCVCCNQGHPEDGALGGPGDGWCQQCQKDGCPVPRKMPGNVSNLTPEQLTGLQDAVGEGAWDNVKLILGVLPEDPFEDAVPVNTDDYDDAEYDKAMEQAAAEDMAAEQEFLEEQLLMGDEEPDAAQLEKWVAQKFGVKLSDMTQAGKNLVTSQYKKTQEQEKLEGAYKDALMKEHPGVEFPSVEELYGKVAKNKAKVNKVKWYDEPCPKHPHKPHCWEIVGLDRVLCLDCHKILDGGQYVNELSIQSPKHMKKLIYLDQYHKELAEFPGVNQPAICSTHILKHKWSFNKYGKAYCDCGASPDGIDAYCLEVYGVAYGDMDFPSQKIAQKGFLEKVEKEVHPPMMVTSGPVGPAKIADGDEDWYAKKAKEYNEKKQVKSVKSAYDEITDILTGYQKMKLQVEEEVVGTPKKMSPEELKSLAQTIKSSPTYLSMLQEKLQAQIAAGMGVDLAKGQDEAVGITMFGGKPFSGPTYFVNEKDYEYMVSKKKQMLSLMDPANPSNKIPVEFGGFNVQISKLVPDGEVYFVNPGLKNPDPVVLKNLSVPCKSQQETTVMVKKKKHVAVKECDNCKGTGSVPVGAVKQQPCVVCNGEGAIVPKMLAAGMLDQTKIKIGSMPAHEAVKKKLQSLMDAEKKAHPLMIMDEAGDLTEEQLESLAALTDAELSKKTDPVIPGSPSAIMALTGSVQANEHVVGSGAAKGTVEAYDPAKHKVGQIIGVAMHSVQEGDTVNVALTGVSDVKILPTSSKPKKAEYEQALITQVADMKALIVSQSSEILQLKTANRQLTMLVGKLYLTMRGPKTDAKDPNEAVRRRFRNILKHL